MTHLQERERVWLVYHMEHSHSFITVHDYLVVIKRPMSVNFVVMCLQAGEGAPKERCGADEASGPQLQTRSSGFTGKCRTGVFSL